MGFQVSPGVEVKEIDLTNVIPAVSTSIGGFAGHFNWGPSEEAVLVSSEKELSEEFGTPTETTYKSFLTAASFLKYTNALYVSRAEPSDARNSAWSVKEANQTTVSAPISNEEDSRTSSDAIAFGRYFGAKGNSIKVHIAVPAVDPGDPSDGVESQGTFASIVAQDLVSDNAGTTAWASANVDVNANDEIHVIVEDAGGEISGTKGAILEVFEGLSMYSDALKDGGTNYYDTVINRDSKYIYVNNTGFKSYWTSSNTMAVPGDSGLTVNSTSGVQKKFGLAGESTNNIAESGVATVGTLTNGTSAARTPGTYTVKINDAAVSTNATGVGAEFSITVATGGIVTAADITVVKPGVGFTAGETITITDVGLGGGGGSSLSFQAASIGKLALQGTLALGVDGTVGTGGVSSALDFLADVNQVDVNLLFAEQTDGSVTVPNKIIQIAGTTRKDCVGFISCDTSSDAEDEVISDFASLSSTSYVVLDSSAVYVYNKYTDQYQYIPAAGHIAGLCARTDNTNDPWFSPAGYNRGQLLGVSKLKFNPNQAERDALYKKGINPIVAQPGQGILLFGDKTYQRKPSAFDRINVRRLFIVLEKAISTASKFQLFELNDEFTRAMFRNMVEPFLRDVKGRRGINDFLVVCDETNNTGNIIDTNRFVADIYIKPARSINFITLNFIATRTGVEFSEIVGTGN
jgi:phage tail sheath protein FI